MGRGIYKGERKNTMKYIKKIIKFIINDIFLFLLLVTFPFFHKKKDAKQIVLVDLMPKMTPRVAKIAYGLKNASYEVVLITSISRKMDERLSSEDELNSYVSKVYFYNPAFYNEILFLMGKFNPLVYHIFVNYNFDAAVNIIKKKKKFGKIVFDEYDAIRGILQCGESEENLKVIEQEKYCLENSDGLCCRSLDSQRLKHYYGYQLPKRILFFDYCWDNIKKPYRENDRQGDSLKLIYAGSIYRDDENPLCQYYCNLKLAEIFKRNKVYYTIYPAYYNQTSYAEYIEASKQNKYFNIEKPITMQKLVAIEQSYDFGTHIHNESIRDFHGDTQVTYYQRELGAANKYFDYVDAGLPILADYYRYFEQYFKHYGMLYKVSLQDIEAHLGNIKSIAPQMRRNVESNRKYMSILYHIPRLIAFYEGLSK